MTKPKQNTTFKKDHTYKIPSKGLEILTTPTYDLQLRTPSDPVDLDDIATPQFQTFADALYKIMITAPLPEGWMPGGISAVQVGKHLNLFWGYDGDADMYELFINPQIELLGNSQDVKEEGCLSIPEITGNVKRHKRIKVKYYDRGGELHKKEFKGWNARVIQHEYDHLLGILFTDKMV
ncbi:MAG: peptide deformylase [Candidatus Dojkabacteria bacterium]